MSENPSLPSNGDLGEAAPETRWKRYPSYIDSGVEWLGNVPEHWTIMPLKRIAGIRYGLGQPPAESLSGLPLLRATNVSRGRITTEGMMFIDPADVPRGRHAELSPNEILVVRSGAYTGDSAIVPEEYAGAVAGYDMVVSVRQAVPAYVAWQLLSSEVNDLQFGFYKCRAAQPHLNAEELGVTTLVLPPLAEQIAISSFLDRETREIDDLIAGKERLLGLLQEKRFAVISNAVVRGLDPQVPMKYSGTDWLGQVPAHWDMKRLKYAGSFVGGGTPSKDNADFWNGDIPWVSPKDMRSDSVTDSEDHITEEAVCASATSLVAPGSVLVVVRSGILRHSIPVAINSCAVALNQDMKAIKAKPFLRAKYLAYLITSHQPVLLSEWTKSGATVESIEHELMANTPCPIPPLAEQDAIIDRLDTETARISSLESVLSAHIDRLREYRTSVISYAVTGKIDVRGELA